MESRRGSTIVVAVAVLLMVGTAIGGVILIQQEPSERSAAPETTWDEYEPVRRSLLVHVSRPDCREVADVDLVEVPGRVEVTLVLAEADRCGDEEDELRHRVRLAEPLRDREVYDGGCLADGGDDEECRRDERVDAPD